MCKTVSATGRRQDKNPARGENMQVDLQEVKQGCVDWSTHRVKHGMRFKYKWV